MKRFFSLLSLFFLIFLVFTACDTTVTTEYVTNTVVEKVEYTSKIFVSESSSNTFGVLDAPFYTFNSAINYILSETEKSSENSEYTLMFSGVLDDDNLQINYTGKNKLSIKLVGLESGGVLDGEYKGSVLTITGENLSITLGEKILLTKGLAGEGGGVHVTDATLIVDGATISNNTAYFAGGGIYVKNGTLNISSGKIAENSASGKGDSSPGANDSFVGHGGGVYITGSKSMQIINNELVGSDSTFTFTGGEISHNTATGPYGGGSGGGVYLNYNTKSTFSDPARISYNVSDYYAGVSMYFAELSCTDSIFINNTSRITADDIGGIGL